MLITQIDIKTGKVLQQPNPETLQLEPKQKMVEHSYLEAWLKRHGLDEAAFFVGEFYAGVDEGDRLRLEEDGKVLVFANGKKGYFTDPDTAQLMIQGDRDIQPIYAQDENAAHNAIAYGSLIASDGIASTLRISCKILVVDDEGALNADFLRLDAVMITTLKGTVLPIQRMLDVEQGDDIWRSDGIQKDWVLEIERDGKSPEGLKAAIVTPQGKQAIGFVTPESIVEYRLDQRVGSSSLRIASPTIEVLPPLRIQHDLDERIREARVYLEGAIGQIPEAERMAYASALWHHSDGMGVVLKGFMPEVTQQLQNLPNIKLTGLQQDVNQVGTIADGSYEVLFTTHQYQKNGEWRSVPAIAVLDDAGGTRTLGAIDPRALRFPEGTIARAEILAGEKVAQVQVTEILRVQKNQGYSPSRSELRDWYLAVKEQGDEEALGRIEAIGRRLNDAYCNEVGAARAASGQAAVTQTPMEFRSALVTITTEELEEMLQPKLVPSAVLQIDR